MSQPNIMQFQKNTAGVIRFVELIFKKGNKSPYYNIF